MFDLIVKGGMVVDPAQGLEGVMDVAIQDGRIAEVRADIRDPECGRIVDAGGKLVVPGLIDLHTHVYWGVTRLGLEADEHCLRHGTTTVLDCGSTGSISFPGFKRWIADASRTRVYCLVNLSCFGQIGLPRHGELADPAHADPGGALEVLRRYPEVAIGVKVRLATGGQAVSGSGLPALRMAREVADEAGVPVMVHIGSSAEPLPEYLELLRPGDVVTHIMTGQENGALDGEGRLLPQVREAREKGVLFDVGHGKANFTFRVAERMLDQGFLPDTISSDLTVFSVDGPAYDLPTTMTKFLALGVSLADVVRCATENPARALGKSGQLGTLAPGSVADVALLQWVEDGFPLVDSAGETRTAARRLAPHLTIRNGDVIVIL